MASGTSMNNWKNRMVCESLWKVFGGEEGIRFFLGEWKLHQASWFWESLPCIIESNPQQVCTESLTLAYTGQIRWSLQPYSRLDTQNSIPDWLFSIIPIYHSSTYAIKLNQYRTKSLSKSLSINFYYRTPGKEPHFRLNNIITFFHIKLWTPEEICGIIFVLWPIRWEMKPQKITGNLVMTLNKTTTSLLLLKCCPHNLSLACSRLWEVGREKKGRAWNRLNNQILHRQ